MTRVCYAQHFSIPILNTLATVLTLAGGDYIFHAQREERSLTKGIVSPLSPPSLMSLTNFRKGAGVSLGGGGVLGERNR